MLLTWEQSFDKTLVRYLAEQMISGSVSSIKRLKGGASYNYEVNRRFVVKLPMLEASRQEWTRQSLCAPIIQSHLSVQVPCPEVKAVFSSVSEKEPIYGIYYEKIGGHTIPNSKFVHYPMHKKISFFEQLSSIMSEIHALNPEELPIRVPRYREQRKMWQFLPKNMIWDYFMRQLDDPKTSEERNIICHTDLHPENLCVSGNKIVGVLDFDSMTFGNAGLEFRPFCYKASDLKLLMKIYQKKSQKSLDAAKIMRVKRAWDMLYLIYALSPFGRSKKNRRYREKRALWKNWVNTR